MSGVIASALVLAVLALVAVDALGQSGAPSRTPLAAERIDVTVPAVPINVVSSFGPDASAAGRPGQLTSSADGDRTVAAVLADLQDFWNSRLSADGGPGLAPLSGGYWSMDSTSPSGSALCIGDPASITGNAFYCAQGDGIVFDSSALVPVLLGAYGDAGLTAAFAHEFGHAVQAQVGPTLADRQQHPDRYPSILIEAQADCDAGAFLSWASSGAAQRVHLPKESLVRAVAPLLDFRDPATVSPADPTAHGLGLDRLSFLLVGFRNGADACPEMSTDDLALTLGHPGVTTSPPSTLPRFPSTADALAAATSSVTTFTASLDLPAGSATAQPIADPADVALAAPLGQFAAGAAVALAAGRSIAGGNSSANSVLAACFTGAWTASVFGKVGVDELGSWPTDADEALDLIRSRPGATFDELVGYADGFHRGWAGCQ